MRHRLAALASLALVPLSLVALPQGTAAAAPDERAAAQRDQRPSAVDDNPKSVPVTELVGQYNLPALKEKDITITVGEWGYRLLGGGVGNKITVTEVDGKLMWVDTAATSISKLARTCKRVEVSRGVGALCSVPAAWSEDSKKRKGFIEIWPRLGNDVVDTHTLSATWRSWVLTDEGNDTIKMGAGNDFANGAFGNDKVSGGDGADWIRVGDATNVVKSGPGDDDVVGGVGRDKIIGGEGDDRLFGGDNNDYLRGAEGADVLNGGAGRDVAVRDGADTSTKDCEVVRT